MVFRRASLKRRRPSLKRRYSAIKRSYPRRYARSSRKGSFKRRYVRSRRAMPSGRVNVLRKTISPYGVSPGVKKAHYKLVTYWNSGQLSFSTSAATPVMFGTAINWNTLNATAHNAVFSNTFGAANVIPPHGIAEIQTRFNATRVVAYRITLSNMRFDDSTDVQTGAHFALSPVSYEDWQNNFTGTAPTSIWPGTTVNDKWQACRMHPGTRTTFIGNGYSDGARHAGVGISCTSHMNKMATDPVWKAFTSYSEYSGTAVVAAFREKMQFTLFFDAPDSGGSRKLVFDVKEEYWVNAFEPEMPAVVTSAIDIGAAAAKAYVDEKRKDRVVPGAGPAHSIDEMDEKEFETSMVGLEIAEPYHQFPPPIPLHRTESKAIIPSRAPSPSVRSFPGPIKRV